MKISLEKIEILPMMMITKTCVRKIEEKEISILVRKLDRTHLDAFLVDFGPYWTNLDIFGPFCLL